MTSRVLTLTVYIASFLFMSVPGVFAQGQEAKPLSARKRFLDQQLTLTLDDIDRSCSLTEAQRSRLKLAAKGAVAASMQKYKAVLAKLRDKVKFAEDGTPEDAQQADDALWEFAYDPANDMTKVTDEPRWKAALPRVLSEEQLKQYTVARDARQRFLRSSAVAEFVAKVDRRLVLSVEQRKKLTALIDDKFGDRLSRFAEDDEFEGLWWDDVVVGKAPIPHKTLAFLSKRQLAEWKRSCEPALGQIEEAEFEVIPFDQLVRDILPPIMWRNMGVAPELAPVEAEPGEAN